MRVEIFQIYFHNEGLNITHAFWNVFGVHVPLLMLFCMHIPFPRHFIVTTDAILYVQVWYVEIFEIALL